ncbi:putative protein cornichon-like protein [Cricetulus griseus]|nr:putative protein cornichon-like protein [Cricetulus griseus]
MPASPKGSKILGGQCVYRHSVHVWHHMSRGVGSLLPSCGFRGLNSDEFELIECDYINARSCCSKLNKWVIPELTGHTIVTVLMLASLHWFIFLLNLPVATWNIYRFIMVPSGNMGVFDPTEIHNRGQLKSHMKEAMIKLGFYLLCFFMYLYSMILALIND